MKKKHLSNYQICILCGGKGERLKPITNKVPKPLININGVPILNYIIKHLESSGAKDLIIASGYKSKMITEYFMNNHNHLNISIVDSGNVDIIKRLLEVRKIVKDKLIVCYGDTIADVNIHNLIEFHNNNPGKISVSSYEVRSQFGLFESNHEGLINDYKEKPILDGRINIGYFVIEKALLNELHNFNTFQEFISFCVKNTMMYNYFHDGYHITVNTINELQEAEENINLLIKK
tara:strand:+ start:60509 stop:61210 length:702 start_codon:yes stop_codon:yes gene_type:complete